MREHTNPVDTGPHHRTPAPSRVRVYEVTGVAEPGRPWQPDELRTLLDSAGEQDDGAAPGPWRRLTADTRLLYRRDDLTGPLPHGVLEPLALPFDQLRLAFTGGLLDRMYGDLLTDRESVLSVDGGYVAHDGGWWAPSGRVSFTPDETADPAAELAFAREHHFLPARTTDPFGAVTTIGYDRYDLLVERHRDAVGDEVTAVNDYRVLQPRQVTDANGNRSAVAFDALGRVTGTAAMGKTGETAGDTLDGFDPDPPEAVVLAHLANPHADPAALLGRATSRHCADPFAYLRSRNDPQPRPAVIAEVAREVHDADGGTATGGFQHRLTYFDGFEREIQRRVPAEPGPDGAPRWVCSGSTVYDRKGNPVRRFDPRFTAGPTFEAGPDSGVSAVLCHDGAGRVVASVLPDHTVEKADFGPWWERYWDRNDLVLLADPRQDPDVGGYLATLPDAELLPSWHTARITGALGERERAAAAQAAVHADTPAVHWLDPLGRAVLVVVHNRSDTDTDELHATRIVFDPDGNERSVLDPLGRVVARFGYDLLGRRVVEEGAESGAHRNLPDVADRPIRGWDSLGHRIRTGYDALRRPATVHLQRDGAPEILGGLIEYGDAAPGAEERNLRGEVYRVRDGAGIATNERYDFKGNLLGSSRQFTADHRAEPDWSAEPALDPAVYTAAAHYDALDRPVSLTAPDGSEIIHAYNEANLLDRVAVRHAGEPQPVPVVAGIDYDAHGNRAEIRYGNGVRTGYEYDPATFRLTRLVTRRDADTLQDLGYTYDPKGNITYIRDGAQQAIIFRNRLVGADTALRHDALYRLVEATGREHLGQLPRPGGPHDGGRLGLPHPGDGNAMGRYRERYDYDAAGNLIRIAHRGTDPAQPGWTREHAFTAASLLDPARTGNRLTGATVSSDGGPVVEAYEHDGHGNMTAMPHLPMLRWDHLGRLRATAAQVSSGTPETTWYCSDAGGGRVRKVTDRAAPQSEPPRRRAERVYLAGFELYREFGGDGTTVVLARTTLQVMDDERRVALIETRTAGTGPEPARLMRYQLGNHLGSSCLEVDDTAAILSYEEYTPYGGTSYQAVRAGLETPKRYRFAGTERDEATGLCYHGARYYAPWLGRWLSPDPEGLVDGVNVYGYARGSPVNRIDPHGRDSFDITPDLEKVLRFVVNEAGFAQGETTPPDPATARQNASRFGTAAHNEELGNAIKQAQDLKLPHAERLVEGVRVDSATGKVTKINSLPGGPKGSLNFDLVYLKEGVVLHEGDLLQSKALMTADAKFGRLSTNQAQAAFARRNGLAHVNLRAGNFAAQVRVQRKTAALGKAAGMKIKKQGGFARIGVINLIAIATAAGIIIASEDRLEAAASIAKDAVTGMALATIIMRVGRVGAGLAGLLSMVVTMESDSPAHNEMMARNRMINDFIHESFPGVLSKYQWCLMGTGWPCTDWQYEIKDAAAYGEIRDAIENLMANPYEFE